MSRIILVPGNGNDQVEISMWYPSVINALTAAKHPKTGHLLFPGGNVLRTFPDPYEAHEEIWIPFMEDTIGINEQDVVIGHSSGAAAIMRYIESRKVKGVVLVSAYHSDLGDPSEREAGYFNRAWNWNSMRANTEWITQFSSPDDHLVPIEEQREVASKILGIDYIELPERGHFIKNHHFPELVENVIRKMST
ncbi:putative hydrolase rbbp9 [Lobosporangium transversale]|uniref:Alpha/Beta hydrolase protein n=1 Tax=Lobosporangium transversale TaxID=64571 RepID=A0A1Y2GHU3_9FUNG|nr:Alpha/Beta hydrolase protein [Lobosporangium transversale]KAF9914627.1 putative hydrolase rbbp9 [Lobosporangium transversale]ORZ11307.1 Alpha/Beta hydrolase protein [Lobosporangium transversale]|eukprot:XP_021879622.1 Alpha/Beta hydrolase protein [Lobosporangium transversale]